MCGFSLYQRQLNAFRSTPLVLVIGYPYLYLHLYSVAFFYVQMLVSLASVVGRGGPRLRV